MVMVRGETTVETTAVIVITSIIIVVIIMVMAMAMFMMLMKMSLWVTFVTVPKHMMTVLERW